jgi:predicted phosphate transport protein (TIGR00153 family)
MNAAALVRTAAVVRLRLTPQKREFFDLYSRASANAVEIARLLVELLSSFPERFSDLQPQIKQLERKGDSLTYDVIDLLNRTFVTPFDRDDMYRLAGALDDVCDFVDEVADNIGLYGVRQIPPEARAQADVIVRAAQQLDDAVGRLEGFRDSREQLVALRELEDEGDRIVREAVAGLFRSGQDPISIIRWKELHEQLEEAVDACQSAADVLEAILVKNR